MVLRAPRIVCASIAGLTPKPPRKCARDRRAAMTPVQAIRNAPLEALLEASGLGVHLAAFLECTISFALLLIAVALRRRRWLVNSGSLILIALGLVADVLTPSAAGMPTLTAWIGALALVFFYCGFAKLAVDLIFRPRGPLQYSTIPRDVTLLLLSLLVVAIVFYAHLNFEVTKLFVSGAVITGTIGLALQEPLRNLFTGLSFHITKPFQPGDWVLFQTHLGYVKGTSWAATEIVTRANERVQIPNAMLISQPVTNFRNEVIADEIEVGISYEDAPGRVKEAILKVVRDIPHVLVDPPPQVFAWQYGDYAIKYRVRYYLGDYGMQETVRDTLVSSLWYALRRHAIDIPFPTQTLQMRRQHKPSRAHADYDREIMADLRRVDFLRELRDEELKMLLPNVTVHQFGAGEVIMHEGEPADSFCVIRSGTVDVSAKAADGSRRHLATTSFESRHPFFGEIAMMSGDLRGATVRAETEVEVLVMSRDGFAHLFKQHSQLAEPIGEIIAAREDENRQLLASAPGTDGTSGFRKKFVEKMRVLFDL